MKMEEKDLCMIFLCSLLDSWEHLVIAIESTTTKLKMEEVVALLLFEEK
jgi:hypothetical protein